jgi:hypothetical protein
MATYGLQFCKLNDSALIFRRGPLITPESLACGAPVVATDVGGNPEYLALAGVDDLLVRASNYDFSSYLARRYVTSHVAKYIVDKFFRTTSYRYNRNL